MLTHALSDPDQLRQRLVRRWGSRAGGTGVGQEVLALRPRHRERGRGGIGSGRYLEELSTSGLRVWEVGHAVGAHAPGERERSRAAARLEDGPELVAARLLVVDRALVVTVDATVDAELVASPTVATLGLCELPPHPATKTALRSAAAVSTRARWGKGILL